MKQVFQDHAALVQELRTTLGKMEIALDAAINGLVWTNAAGQVQWCNAGFLALLRQPKLAVLGQSLTAIFPLRQGEIGIPDSQHPVTRALETGCTSTEVYEFQSADQQYCLEVSWSSFVSHGTDRSAMLVVRNATVEYQSYRALQQNHENLEALVEERSYFLKLANTQLEAEVAQTQHMADRLQESEARFRLLIDNVKDHGIYLLDAVGNVASWNAGAERLHQYVADEVMGQSLSLFFMPEEQYCASQMLQIANETGEYQGELRHRRKMTLVLVRYGAYGSPYGCGKPPGLRDDLPQY
ncbi:MAG: PAS domain-containing protein [Alkalinema sp. RL_2_19]|nr:PAS domain-containing protein [Alkalinema sp. RL_2_19]